MSGMDKTTGQAITGLDHLRQSISDILFTPLGSRIQRRTYGSLVPELLDQPDNDTTRVRLYSAVVGAIAKWEPRLKVTRVQLQTGPAPGQGSIVLTGRYMGATTAGQVVTLPITLRAAA